MNGYINIYKHSSNGKYVTYGRHDNDTYIGAAEDAQMEDRTEYAYLHTFEVTKGRITDKLILDYDVIVNEAKADWNDYRSSGSLSQAQMGLS